MVMLMTLMMMMKRGKMPRADNCVYHGIRHGNVDGDVDDEDDDGVGTGQDATG